MNISKRQFIIGLSALIAAPANASINVPIARPLSESAIFSFNEMSDVENCFEFIRTAKVLRSGDIGFDSKYIQYKFFEEKISSTNSHLASKITNADIIDQYYVNMSQVMDFSDIKTSLHPFAINSASAQVAKNTRFTRANNIIVSDKNLDLIEMIKDGRRLGMRDNMIIHVREWLPKNEAFVFYKKILGAFTDGPGILFNNGNVHINNNVCNYGIKLKFKE